MGKILDAFADNELYTIAITEKRSPKRQKLIEKSYQLHEKLSQKLNEEENELLEQLLDTISEDTCCYAQNNFVRGYCLGVLMTMEVFSEQNSFL